MPLLLAAREETNVSDLTDLWGAMYGDGVEKIAAEAPKAKQDSPVAFGMLGAAAPKPAAPKPAPVTPVQPGAVAKMLGAAIIPQLGPANGGKAGIARRAEAQAVQADAQRIRLQERARNKRDERVSSYPGGPNIQLVLLQDQVRRAVDGHEKTLKNEARGRTFMDEARDLSR